MGVQAMKLPEELEKTLDRIWLQWELTRDEAKSFKDKLFKYIDEQFGNRAEITKDEYIALLEHLNDRQQIIDECHSIFNEQGFPADALQARIKMVFQQRDKYKERSDE
jgi:allantoicase